MPSKYGTGLYGKGNYSALTASSVTAAQGSLTETGEAVTLSWQAKLAFAAGAFTETGIAVGLGKIAWAVAAGAISLAGQAVSFVSGNLWAAQADGTASWTPTVPAADPWTPVSPGSETWTPTL